MNRLFVIESSVYFRSIDKLNDFDQNAELPGQVKYQKSSIGFENLAHLQSIEKRCNGTAIL